MRKRNENGVTKSIGVEEKTVWDGHKVVDRESKRVRKRLFKEEGKKEEKTKERKREAMKDGEEEERTFERRKCKEKVKMKVSERVRASEKRKTLGWNQQNEGKGARIKSY